MNKNDVEMEDPEKLPNDSGNSLQESKSVAFDATVGSEVEKSSCAAAVLGDINEREDDGEDLTKCRTEVKDQNELKTDVNPQIKSEVNRTIEGSVSGNINIKGENVNTIINTVEKTASVSPVEKQIDAKKQVVAQKATSGGVEENMSESGVDRRNVEERPSEDVAEKQPKEQTAPVTPVEKHIDAKNEVVAQKATSGGVEENMPFENVIEGGDHRKNVEERANEDVAEKLPKEIGKEDMGHSEHVVGGDLAMGNAGAGDNSKENSQLLTELSANNDPQSQDAQSEEVGQGEDEDAVKFDEDETIKDNKQDGGAVLAGRETDGNENTVEIAAKNEREESSLANQNVAAKSKFLFSCSSAKTEEHSGDIANRFFTQSTTTPTGEADDGTPEDQAAFMKELESFHQEKAMDFKPPKFYGQQLNCLKLWRAVIRLGGYDKVTGSKLWRQVGESFHPPKTCTTVSWTFRIFYEKSLLEYERHKIQSGELQLPVAMLSEVSGADGEGSGSGSGRARRDAAARYMQGWHAQSLPDSGEDKNLNDIAMHEKDLKSIGSLKQKRPNEVEHPSKAARIELSKQSVASVVDIGPPADWVKINVRQNTDCFEVYALVPGLLREEVRVQSDPAGRVVITGQPGQVDNPWGITPFKKVVCLPARIDPVQTSAVVSLHGRLFIRVPFEQPTS